MKLTVICLLVAALLSPSPAFAGAGSAAPLGRAVEKAAGEAAAAAQAEAEHDGGNPYKTPGLVMIGAGIIVAVLGSTMPQFRTQTDDYDLCAAANGGPTGPSTRVPACDSYRTVNKGMLAVGLASAFGGAALLTVGALKKSSVTVQVAPGRVAIAKAARF